MKFTQKKWNTRENPAALSLEALCFQYYLGEKQNHKDRHGNSSMCGSGIYAQGVQVLHYRNSDSMKMFCIRAKANLEHSFIRTFPNT